MGRKNRFRYAGALIGGGMGLSLFLVRTVASLIQKAKPKPQQPDITLISKPQPSKVPAKDKIRIPITVTDQTALPKTDTVNHWHCPQTTENALFVGSDDRDKVHHLNCRHAQNIAPEHRLCFLNREAAIELGYSACDICKPFGDN